MLKLLKLKLFFSRFGVAKLFGEIDIKKSKILQKAERISIIMEKSNSKHWDQLAYKESKVII